MTTLFNSDFQRKKKHSSDRTIRMENSIFIWKMPMTMNRESEGRIMFYLTCLHAQ